MALTQRKASKENPGHQKIQPQQPPQFEQPVQQENSTSITIPIPLSKEELLLLMLQEYKEHISPSVKPKITPESELPSTDAKLSAAPAPSAPTPVTIDNLTLRKRLALGNLMKATDELMNNNNAHKLYKAFGQYEEALEKVRDWNPATGMGLKYTHGKKLVIDIRKLFPKIDNEAAYLAGKTMQVLQNYLTAKHHDALAVVAQKEDKILPEEKKLSDEKKMHNKCVELMFEFHKIDFSDHDKITEGLQKALDDSATLYALVYKFKAKNTGFIASVTSKLATIPEDQLLIDLNSIKEKFEESLTQKQVAQNKV